MVTSAMAGKLRDDEANYNARTPAPLVSRKGLNARLAFVNDDASMHLGRWIDALEPAMTI
jgi:hypothetical protein